MEVQHPSVCKVHKGWAERQTFVYSPHEKLSNQLLQLLHDSPTYKLYKKIDCTIAKHEKNVPGESVTVSRFNLKETYYLNVNGKLNSFFLNKKGLKSAIKADIDIFKWAKLKKIDLSSDEGIVLLLEQLSTSN